MDKRDGVYLNVQCEPRFIISLKLRT